MPDTKLTLPPLPEPVRRLVEQLAEYVEGVPDDRLNVEHLDREQLVAAARALLRMGPLAPAPFAWATLCDDTLHSLSHTELSAKLRAENLREANRGRGFLVGVVPLYRAPVPASTEN